MAEAKAEQEPSIEEILESIRQIISDDTEEEAKAAESETVLKGDKEDKVPASDLSLTPEAEKPVPPSNLSLTPKAEKPVPPSNLSLTPKAEKPVPSSDLSLTPKAEKPDAKKEPLSLTPDIAEPVNSRSSLDLSQAADTSMDIEMMNMDIDMTDSEVETPKETAAADALMSPETANAVTTSLAKLLTSNLAVESDTHNSKVTLEEMALILMKPLIKAWLDKNLPAIIEKAVTKEVEKLSRRAMDR